MDFQHRISLIRLLTAACLLSMITIGIFTRMVTGSGSNIDEWENDDNQYLHPSLTGKIHELVSTDDSDTRLEHPLDTDREYPAAEGYRLENVQYTIPSTSPIVSKERILSREKRDVMWIFETDQTSPMDGSGTTIEGSTSEAATDTTQSATTVYLSLADFTNASTVSADHSTTYQAPDTTATSREIEISVSTTETTPSSSNTSSSTEYASSVYVTSETTENAMTAASTESSIEFVNATESTTTNITEITTASTSETHTVTFIEDTSGQTSLETSTNYMSSSQSSTEPSILSTEAETMTASLISSSSTVATPSTMETTTETEVITYIQFYTTQSSSTENITTSMPQTLTTTSSSTSSSTQQTIVTSPTSYFIQSEPTTGVESSVASTTSGAQTASVSTATVLVTSLEPTTAYQTTTINQTSEFLTTSSFLTLSTPVTIEETGRTTASESQTSTSESTASPSFSSSTILLQNSTQTSTTTEQTETATVSPSSVITTTTSSSSLTSTTTTTSSATSARAYTSITESTTVPISTEASTSTQTASPSTFVTITTLTSTSNTTTHSSTNIAITSTIAATSTTTTIIGSITSANTFSTTSTTSITTATSTITETFISTTTATIAATSPSATTSTTISTSTLTSISISTSTAAVTSASSIATTSTSTSILTSMTTAISTTTVILTSTTTFTTTPTTTTASTITMTSTTTSTTTPISMGTTTSTTTFTSTSSTTSASTVTSAIITSSTTPVTSTSSTASASTVTSAIITSSTTPVTSTSSTASANTVTSAIITSSTTPVTSTSSTASASTVTSAIITSSTTPVTSTSSTASANTVTSASISSSTTPVTSTSSTASANTLTSTSSTASASTVTSASITSSTTPVTSTSSTTPTTTVTSTSSITPTATATPTTTTTTPSTTTITSTSSITQTATPTTTTTTTPSTTTVTSTATTATFSTTTVTSISSITPTTTGASTTTTTANIFTTTVTSTTSTTPTITTTSTTTMTTTTTVTTISTTTFTTTVTSATTTTFILTGSTTPTTTTTSTSSTTPTTTSTSSTTPTTTSTSSTTPTTTSTSSTTPTTTSTTSTTSISSTTPTTTSTSSTTPTTTSTSSTTPTTTSTSSTTPITTSTSSTTPTTTSTTSTTSTSSTTPTTTSTSSTTPTTTSTTSTTSTSSTTPTTTSTTSTSSTTPTTTSTTSTTSTSSTTPTTTSTTSTTSTSSTTPTTTSTTSTTSTSSTTPTTTSTTSTTSTSSTTPTTTSTTSTTSTSSTTPTTTSTTSTTSTSSTTPTTTSTTSTTSTSSTTPTTTSTTSTTSTSSTTPTTTSTTSTTSTSSTTPTTTSTTSTTSTSSTTPTTTSTTSTSSTTPTTTSTSSTTPTTTSTTSTSSTTPTTTSTSSTTPTTTSTSSTTPTTTSTSTPISTATSTSISTTVTTSSITTAIPQNCAWTSWVPLGNCTPSCGTAYRTSIRGCIDSSTGQSCSSVLCGGGYAVTNETCSFSPPCETLTVTLPTNVRDPTVRIASYILPDSMYFFDQTYRRIWISSKGYISFDTPYYGQTMTSSAFQQIFNQAIAAPFWTDLLYDTSYSTITINWFSSTNSSGNDANSFYPVIQSVILAACPTGYCSLDFAAARVVRISWQNLFYELPSANQTINVSFSAYLINTYEYSSYSYPLLRSYIAFDYSNLTQSLGNLRPFIGYRSKYNVMQILNNPFFYQNAAFLVQHKRRNFYAGGRFLSQCEVSFMQETRINVLYPSENLNDEIINPRVPCSCTLGQAFVDGRFARLFSETYYEVSQNVVCFAPMTTTWIWWGSTFKLLRSQTCCYSSTNRGLITSGPLAGSVLSNPSILFQQYYWLRRIPFHDQCCAPSYLTGYSDWSTCQQYYQLHPPSSCSGYQSPTIVTGLGDPHMTTIDNGRYTCHIQGLYVFARTTTAAATTAQANLNSNAVDTNLIYPDDLFEIQVRSVVAAPALYYVELTQGSGSIFSSYTVISVDRTFTISNSNGKFGFVASDGLSLTNALSTYAVYDYTNLNSSNTDSSERHIYRVQQTNQMGINRSISQLTLTLWSGLSMQCQVIGENLDCVLMLPQKYQSHIEGLIGNFNRNYSDDLFNRQTNQTITISSASNQTLLNNDGDVLSACRSWKVPTDTTADLSFPIMPTELINWYYNNASGLLASLNPLLNQTIVNQTCGSSFECVHDYLIRINAFTSGATAVGLQSFQQSRTTLADVPPTVNITSDVRIVSPVSNTTRNYSLPISINGSSVPIVLVAINANGSASNTTLSGGSIVIPMPTTARLFVEVSLIITYGINSTFIQFLDIIACLCTNNGTCNYDQTTTLSTHYRLASCDCPDLYEGDLCESDYNGCNSGSACRVNWNNNTRCVSLTASQQQTLGRSYICNGTCQNGYLSSNNFTCGDINECALNSSLCGNGMCINQIGSYTCNCTNGYRFNGQTCIDIDECSEPNTDGTFPRRCNDGEVCTNTIGSYGCVCSPVFNTTGICLYDPSRCNFANNDTCVINNTTVICLHSTINVNNICLPWCRSTCTGFCDMNSDSYECNCMKYPGFQRSDDGMQCLQCRGLNYGYGCNESCECVHGTCNPNATNVNQSCSCDVGYQRPLCAQLVDTCAQNSACNSATEDCSVDPNNATAICTCKLGYEKNDTAGTCTDVNECARKADNCNPDSSTCSNTVGSYVCSCNSGYQSVNGSCTDINECLTSANCTSYINTFCTNTPGSYECRCCSGYSVGGDKTRIYENVRNTNYTCLQTNFSSDCINTCESPAVCSSTTGQCQCPIATMHLGSANVNTKQTCKCPGDPFVNYTNGVCDYSTSGTWLLIYFDSISSVSTGRSFNISSPVPSTLEAEICVILNGLNKTCDGSMVQVNVTRNTDLAPVEVFVALTVSLNATERLQLINGFYDRGVSLNSSYALSIRMIINQGSKKLEIFSSAQAPCQECYYLDRGVCSQNNNNTCNCFNNYQGYFCRNPIETSLQSTPSTNWTVIVASISAIAGLLLIIAVIMVLFYILSRRHNRRRAEAREITSSSGRKTYVIPRVHLPTTGAAGRDNSTRDVYNLAGYGERHNDTSDSYPSSSTTYNPSYPTSDTVEEPTFGIFDDLDRYRPIGGRSIQQLRMADTFRNVFPHQMNDSSAGTNSFSNLNELHDMELVTDMLDDMTKYDDMPDDFVEAFNSNVDIPRATVQPQYESSGWFSFFRDS